MKLDFRYNITLLCICHQYDKWKHFTWKYDETAETRMFCPHVNPGKNNSLLLFRYQRLCVIMQRRENT